MQDKVSALSLELLGHRGSSVLPVETLCLELQNIADEFSRVGGSVRRSVFSRLLRCRASFMGF